MEDGYYYENIIMKDVTILTFDEMEMIRHDIDNIIDKAKEGVYGKQDGETACKWVIEGLKEFRSQFE